MSNCEIMTTYIIHGLLNSGMNNYKHFTFEKSFFENNINTT